MPTRKHLLSSLFSVSENSPGSRADWKRPKQMWTWTGRKGFRTGAWKQIFLSVSKAPSFLQALPWKWPPWTWECVPCIFHSSLPRKNFQFSENSKTRCGRGAGFSPTPPLPPVWRAGPAKECPWGPRKSHSQHFWGNCCCKNKHLRLWLSRVKVASLSFFSPTPAHSGCCANKLISEGAGSPFS